MKRNKVFNLIFLSLIFLFLFLGWGEKARAGLADHVVISEIQITGGHGKATNDFIELYNPTNLTIDLSGWQIKKRIQSSFESSIKVFSKEKSIPPYGYFLWANSKNDFHLKIEADEWSTATLTENNSIALFDNNKNLIDAVAWGFGHENPFVETKPYPVNPDSNQSLERKSVNNQGNGEDSDDNSQDYLISNFPTPKNSQSFFESLVPEPIKENEVNKDSANSLTEDIKKEEQSGQLGTDFQISPSDIVINEFVSDPIDGEEEWIELYNKREEEIDLNDWQIEEGSGGITKISWKIPPNEFFVIEKIKGYLNNSGDIVILRDKNGRIIDQVTYGDYGNKENNVPRANDPYSVARIIDGFDTDQDNLDFKISTTPTKGKPNKFPLEEKNYPFGVIINELLPNSRGDDSENEFIELKNLNDFEIDLEGWKLEDASGIKFIISSKSLSSTIISPKGFLVLKRKLTNIPLNNFGSESLRLYQPNENLVDFIKYNCEAQEDFAYTRDKEGNWEWTIQPTPAQENIIKKANQLPKAIISAKNKALVGEEIIFDASDSYDPDRDSLIYFWDFGDGKKSSEIVVKHNFQKAGKYKVKLEVEDSFGAKNAVKLNLEILEDKKIPLLTNFEAEILISEFLPNPIGSDEEEWIEIFNDGEEEIDLSGWFLDDQEGQSRPYRIKKETRILPGEYLVFCQKETKIVLNNNFDSVRILDPEGNLFYEVLYQKVKEGHSFVINEKGEWGWASILTPGEKNKPNQKEKRTQSLELGKEVQKKVVLEVPISEIRNRNLGDLVKVQGIVSVEPGVLGKQIFYLLGSGIQVYFYKKDFPNLKVGDRIEVMGEIRESKGERKIKINSKKDIKILEKEVSFWPKEIKTGEVNENLEGNLVSIEGEVVNSKPNYLYLDDGSGKIKIYFKKTTEIKKPRLKEGEWLKVIGIISQNGKEYHLLPRYQSDFKIIKKREINNFSMASFLKNNTFSGAENVLPKKGPSEKIKYLLLFGIALLTLLILLLIKFKDRIFYEGK